MRIISGYYKGRRLCSFSADFIRPMTDRVKTSVFNSLYSKLGGMENQRVLDLFSGTGNLALEALSRGAREVYMVDSHKKAIQIIRENCRLLTLPSKRKKSEYEKFLLEGGKSVSREFTQKGIRLPDNVKICQKDVFHFLSAYKGKSFNLIFADPPFKKHYGEKILKACVSSKALGKGTTLVLEISTQEKTLEETNLYPLILKKQFGDKQVLFYSFLTS